MRWNAWDAEIDSFPEGECAEEDFAQVVKEHPSALFVLKTCAVCGNDLWIQHKSAVCWNCVPFYCGDVGV